MATLEEAEFCFPKLLNSSCKKIMRPHSVSMLTYITLSSISVLTVTLNLMVIVSICHFKKLHTPTNLLLLSLAVSDFFVGLLIVFQIILIDGCWFLGDLMCSLYFLFDYVITSASVGTMVLISIDRYVAICFPFHYSTKVTVRSVFICVCVCWTCSFLYNCLILKDNFYQPGRYSSCYGECVIIINSIAGISDTIITFIIPITVIVVVYLKVFVVVMSQVRSVRPRVAAVTLQGSVKVNLKKSELKAARTLGVVVVVFLICACPYFCVTLTGGGTVFTASSVAFVMCLFYLNSCLNPLIYALFYPWFRKSVKLTFTLQILRPGSCDANIV
ncbi:trace amine-associated receptor 13c-like [Salarias fasciatus]|uniref:Trace amine-associated receptor 13c-like n=1 Tax=Salarias fasciatus TaxID=181472 RepID=A0A672HV81_SALFA|nr:trace amine-associated receptor 13c-like [Salarias fasciatus]